MIVCHPQEAEHYEAQGLWGEATLDGLLRAAADDTPDSPALVDAPDKARFADTPWMRLNCAEADFLVDALAARFLALGFKSDDVVAVQLGNVVENHLTLLALMRANLIACPLPPLWREFEIKAALNQVQPRAIVTATRIGAHRHGDMMRFVAADVFTVRHVLAFGDHVPDGVLGLNDILEDGERGALSAEPRTAAANHAATVTWQTAREGNPMPVMRSHNHWIAAARAHVQQAGLGSSDTIFHPLFPSNLTALATGLASWLVCGASLALYQAGAEQDIAARIADTAASYAVLPPAAIAALGADGAFDAEVSPLRALACAWPSPEMAAWPDAPDTSSGDIACIDVHAFGECALLAVRRGGAAPAMNIPLGPVETPGSEAMADVFLETRLAGGPRKAAAGGPALAGTLQLRGAMVPPCDSPARDGLFAANGFVASAIACEIVEGDTLSARFLAREDGVVTVGAAPVSTWDMDAILTEHSGVREAALFTVPDPVLGNRLHAAAVSASTGPVSLADMHTYLAARKIAPHKFPEALIAVDALPRTQDGAVARGALADAV